MDLKIIKDNWMIIVLICTTIIWYANTNSRLNALEKGQAQQQITLAKVDTLVTDVAVINTNVAFIKEKIK